MKDLLNTPTLDSPSGPRAFKSMIGSLAICLSMLSFGCEPLSSSIGDGRSSLSMTDDTSGGQVSGVDGGQDAASDSPSLPPIEELEWPTVVYGPPTLRRLTQRQFKRSLEDLLSPELTIPDLAEPDVESGGLLSVGASVASLSAHGVESLEDVVRSITTQAMALDDLRERLAPCLSETQIDLDSCGRETFSSFGRRAWRRPLSEVELNALLGIMNRAYEVLDDHHSAIRYGLSAILQSPNFIFRSELGLSIDGEPSTTPHRPLNAWELATRLSYFLWNSTPDDELLDAAERGELATFEGLKTQANRLLASERSREAVRTYFEEHLHLYALKRLRKDPTLFEHYYNELGLDARDETLKLIEHIVFEREDDIRTLLTTRETFLNPSLSSLYRVPSPNEDGFGWVEYPEGHPRAGLLGQVSFLGLHSHAVSSSATLRGKAIRSLFLCQSIPTPPVDVDTSIPEPSGMTRTLRERVAEHLENPSCAGCHLLTDPIGLGLEQFDAIGRWRTTDHDALIDPSGDLDEIPFDTPIELAERIRSHPAFVPCMVETVSRYAIGRAPSMEERLQLEVLADRFERGGHLFKGLLLEIALSPMFRFVQERE